MSDGVGVIMFFGRHATDETSMEQPADEVVEEMKKLQGVWQQIAYERDGVSDPPDEQGLEPTTTFVGDRFVVTVADGSTPIRGTYRLDPTKNPKTVDWLDAVGEDAGRTIPGIYSLEGDRFVFCAAYAGQERPTEFRTRPGEVLRVSRRHAPHARDRL
jgi:uncharacterized protein (TIGR03067 family)